MREYSRQDADAAVAFFLAACNEARSHMGIDGLMPVDRFLRARRSVAGGIQQGPSRGCRQALDRPPGGAIEEAPQAGARDAVEKRRGST